MFDYEEAEPEDGLKIDSGSCPNCSWSGLLVNAETDTEWDEFYRIDRLYPICPKCGDGLDDFYPSELN